MKKSNSQRSHSVRPREDEDRRQIPKLGAGRLVMGRNCLEELLRHCPVRLIKVFAAESTQGGARRDELLGRMQAQGVKFEIVRADLLTRLVGSDSHQGFVAEVQPVLSDLKEFLGSSGQKQRSLVLMLDNVSDPHNVGAIFRAAECFGVDAVLWSRNRGAGLTPVVAKSSVGASELVPGIEVGNLVEAAKRFKEYGYWVIAADVGDGAAALRDFDVPDKSMVIVGSEGEGLQPLLLKTADFLVKIPLHGRIDSLNVSQATAVLLYEISARQGSRE